MGSYAGEVAKVQRLAEEQGFRVTRTTNGHYQFYAPNRKDIIVTGGTPGDGRSWNNFMSQMRRAGFDPSPGAKTSLGDALAEAKAPPQEQAVPGLVATVRDAVRNRGAAGIEFSELCSIAASRRGDGLNRNSVSAALSHLKSRGEVVDVERGRWRWVGNEHEHAETPWVLRNGTEAAAAEVASDAPEADAMRAEATTGAAAPAPQAAGAPADPTDDELADDLRTLDRLLEALADAEGVIRRNREYVAKRGELRAQKSKLAALLAQLGEV
jgi:hypothetical protein